MKRTVPHVLPKTSRQTPLPRTARSRVWRGCVLCVLILFSACALLLWTPAGEQLTAFTVQSVLSARLSSVGQRVRVGAAGELWRGGLALWNVSVQDAQGEWLFVPYMRVSLAIPDFFPKDGGVITLRLARVDINNADMARLPVLSVADEDGGQRSHLEQWTFAPQYMRLNIHSLRLNAARLSNQGERLYVNAHARLALSNTTARVRMTMDARERSYTPRPLPAPTELPADVQHFPRAPREESHSAAAPDTALGTATDTATEAATDALHMPEGYSLLSFDWDKGYVDMRAQAHDSLLLRRYFPNINRVWSRWRVQAHVPLWPPDVQHPARARWSVRFGLRTDILTDRVRASSLTGQILWDGKSCIVRDVSLAMPAQDPKITFRGSAGFDPEHGPGLSGALEFSRLHDLVRLLGLSGPLATLEGSLQTRVDIWRGGRHAAWWLAPLPESVPFAAHPLPGLEAIYPPPFVDVDALPSTTVEGLRATLSPTAMRIRCTMNTPYLRVPGGELREARLTINGLSAAADIMQGEEQLFTTLGLPQALVGALEVQAQALPGLGATTGAVRWSVSGMHSTEGLRVHLADMALHSDNARLDGNLSIATALGQNQAWPWLDGDVHLAVRDASLLSEVWGGTLRAEALDVRLNMDSDPLKEGAKAKERRQSADMRLEAERFEEWGVALRRLSATARSEHAHALADVGMLTLRSGRGGTKQAWALAGEPLCQASLRSGPGTAASWAWQQGQGSVNILGEDAHFEVRFAGGTEGVLRGVYDVRERLLRVDRLDVREAYPKK